MVNKALRIVLYTIFTISLLFVVPFNNIFADGLIVVNGSDYLLGINVDLYDSSLETYVNQAFITSNNGTSNYSQYTQTNVINQVEIGTYKYTFVFNKSYVGRIVLQYVVPNSQTTRQFTLFVNGTTAEYYSSRDNRYSSTSTFINNWTLSSAQLVEHDDIESLEQIVDLLTDIYSDTTDLVGASADQLTELQNIVANTSLSNTYLNEISQLRQWHIPIESFQAVLYCMRLYNTYEVKQLNYFDYPMFNLSTGNSIASFFYNKNYSYILIFGTNYNFSYNASGLADMFDTTQEISSYQIQELYSMNAGIKIVKCIINFPNNGNINIKLKHDSLYIPIYSSLNLYKYYSLEFALRYGLSNQLLDNLQLIANGTNASSAASSQSDQANSQLQQDSNTLFQQEDSFKQDMNSAMQNIDTTFTLNNFGSSFMTSAQWVRTQYETLTNNTPFASLITFSLLVGLALIVVGKVYK